MIVLNGVPRHQQVESFVAHYSVEIVAALVDFAVFLTVMVQFALENLKKCK